MLSSIYITKTLANIQFFFHLTFNLFLKQVILIQVYIYIYIYTIY